MLQLSGEEEGLRKINVLLTNKSNGLHYYIFLKEGLGPLNPSLRSTPGYINDNFYCIDSRLL